VESSPYLQAFALHFAGRCDISRCHGLRSSHEALVAALRSKHVQPLSVGKTIVATREPHEREVLDIIHRLGLELQDSNGREVCRECPRPRQREKALAIS
jgi:hypothetical protein